MRPKWILEIIKPETGPQLIFKVGTPNDFDPANGVSLLKEMIAEIEGAKDYLRQQLKNLENGEMIEMVKSEPVQGTKPSPYFTREDLK